LGLRPASFWTDNMRTAEEIRAQIPGTPAEQARRAEMLETLLDAFDRGGSDAVTSELKGRLDSLRRSFDSKLKALDSHLS
jgi:hypothetical protein